MQLTPFYSEYEMISFLITCSWLHIVKSLPPLPSCQNYNERCEQKRERQQQTAFNFVPRGIYLSTPENWWEGGGGNGKGRRRRSCHQFTRFKTSINCQGQLSSRCCDPILHLHNKVDGKEPPFNLTQTNLNGKHFSPLWELARLDRF